MAARQVARKMFETYGEQKAVVSEQDDFSMYKGPSDYL